eukprot:3222734-Alexandrium_andersonii.AAC.1
MTAARFAAEASALVYHIRPEDEEMKLACPNMLVGRDITLRQGHDALHLHADRRRRPGHGRHR